MIEINLAQALGDALSSHVERISACVNATALDAGWRVIGMDTSAAPSKSCASMVQVYELLGVPFFGASGTVEASALLTRVFKSVQHMPQIGFSGLMLAVTLLSVNVLGDVFRDVLDPRLAAK